MLTIFSAILAEAASIILPSSWAAPFPSLAAFSSSSKILLALFTSASGGEKTLIKDIRFTGVLEKRGKNWKIVQFHSSVGVAGQVLEY